MPMSLSMQGSFRLLVATALCVVAVPAASAFAQADSNRTTFLLSRAFDGGLPNGVSRNAAVSHDQRIAQAIAYESDATNIVPGDTNGLTDVFVVHRAGPWGHSGTPWTAGGTDLVSHGLGGQPANGRSYRPAVDGDSHHSPSCVAFVSDASNLVPGDTNGKPDAFVYNLRTKQVTRVSTDSHGRQSNGSTYEVSVDGDCERVAFVSDATNLALKSTKALNWGTARTSDGPAGATQVYVKVLRASGHDRGFKGMTFLASANHHGRAGNGNSSDASFARAGKAVVFASDASNLSPADHNGATDVYERTFNRHYVHIKHHGEQVLQFRTILVSANGHGTAGNGASTDPTVSDNGQYVAYSSLANNLARGDTNGVSDVFEANLAGRHPRQAIVSHSHYSGLGDGPSQHPVISDAGEFVLFDSLANNLRPSGDVATDTNGVRDVFLWNRPTGNVSLESRDSANGYLPYASQHPATSARGNYVPFESANPSIDATSARASDVADAANPASTIPQLIDPDVIAPTVPTVAVPGLTGPDPALEQVYVRYLGPQ
jgi:Tol biopolymer transport system component